MIRLLFRMLFLAALAYAVWYIGPAAEVSFALGLLGGGISIAASR